MPGDGRIEDVIDLRHHGDADIDPGLVDCAVNVRANTPPPWLRNAIAETLGELAAYPDQASAIRAVAEVHRRPAGETLLTSGAAEAFVLIARALQPRHAVVVHPQFTEPEAALRQAGHDVERLILPPDDGFTLDPARVPYDADLVVIGNPTNPTGVLHSGQKLEKLAKPGRVLVVDEAFMDFVPDERESLAQARGIPGLVVVRSLTKMWGLAGLRVGYLVGDPEVVALLRNAQPLWPLSTPALAAVTALSGEAARAEARQVARATAQLRSVFLAGLRGIDGVLLAGIPAANFVLVHTPGRPDIVEQLRRRGFVIRRGDTFPGLGAEWARITVREAPTQRVLLAALGDALAEHSLGTRDAAAPGTGDTGRRGVATIVPHRP